MTIEEYIHANFLAQDIERKLLSQLEIMQTNLVTIVDVGCGVGPFKNGPDRHVRLVRAGKPLLQHGLLFRALDVKHEKAGIVKR